MAIPDRSLRAAPAASNAARLGFTHHFILAARRRRPRGEVKRIVIIKLDGVPQDVLERELRRVDPATRKSALPWIDRVFAQQGARLANFYVRAISLSTPSWSLLDTGRHLQIHGNAEFDRYTYHVYDYLNFFPFYLGYALSHRVDMPGVEVLDDLGIPLLIDRFPYQDSYQSFQLFQRGVRWKTLQHGLQRHFTSRSLRDLLDEWTIGFEIGSSVEEQTERELIEKLADPQIRYLDYFTGDYDHVAHGTPDLAAQRQALQTYRRPGGTNLDRDRSQPGSRPNRPGSGLRSRNEYRARRLQSGLRSRAVLQQPGGRRPSCGDQPPSHDGVQVEGPGSVRFRGRRLLRKNRYTSKAPAASTPPCCSIWMAMSERQSTFAIRISTRCKFLLDEIGRLPSRPNFTAAAVVCLLSESSTDIEPNGGKPFRNCRKSWPRCSAPSSASALRSRASRRSGPQPSAMPGSTRPLAGLPSNWIRGVSRSAVIPSTWALWANCWRYRRSDFEKHPPTASDLIPKRAMGDANYHPRAAELHHRPGAGRA